MTKDQIRMLADDPKAFLQMPAVYEKKIKLKEVEMQRYRDLAVGITQTIKPVVTFTGGPSRKIEQCVTEIVSLEEDIAEELSAFYQYTVLTKEAIGYIKDGGLYNVLWARYLCRMSWSRVAEALGCSERWVYRQHAMALEELRKIAEEKLSRPF